MNHSGRMRYDWIFKMTLEGKHKDVSIDTRKQREDPDSFDKKWSQNPFRNGFGDISIFATIVAADRLVVVLPMDLLVIMLLLLALVRDTVSFIEARGMGRLLWSLRIVADLSARFYTLSPSVELSPVYKMLASIVDMWCALFLVGYAVLKIFGYLTGYSTDNLDKVPGLRKNDNGE